jgi:hypothetical protein
MYALSIYITEAMNPYCCGAPPHACEFIPIADAVVTSAGCPCSYSLTPLITWLIAPTVGDRSMDSDDNQPEKVIIQIKVHGVMLYVCITNSKSTWITEP